MTTNYKGWRKLFLFCFGLFAGTAFCMKWMEGDLVQGGKVFTVIGLEATYTQEKIMAIFSGLEASVRTILQYHLYFDFAFMAGVYPGIAALCMMGREKAAAPLLRRILLALAALQLVAWGCDIVENYYLLQWIKNPVMGNDFGVFHAVVYAKWVLALLGAVMGIVFAIKKRRKVPVPLQPGGNI